MAYFYHGDSDPNAALRCTLFVWINWHVEFKDDATGSWTQMEKDDWLQRAKSTAENYFGEQPYKCFCKCGECPQGVSVVFALYLNARSRFGADYGVTVLHSLVHQSRTTSWILGHSAELDRGDVDPQDKGVSQPQLPLLHELGHMLGLSHPGGASNTYAAYAADPDSLMGFGNTLRIGDFDKAFCKHIRGKCKNWQAQPATK